jgi:protein-tyrosine phosphatase
MPLIPVPIVLDYDRIDDLVYLGGRPDPKRDYSALGFDLLVLCAEDARYRVGAYPKVRVLCAPMADSTGPGALMSIAVAQEAAGVVVKQAKAGKKVLVTCETGRNSSALVVSLALRDLYGWKVKECISLIRSRRRPKIGFVLDNKEFTDWAKALP